MHVAVWPALPIVLLHPSENVVVSGAITETMSPPKIGTYRSPLSGLKAMPLGTSPTGMWDAHNGVCCAVYDVDGVAAGVCHVQEPVVGVEGNSNWI